MKKFLILALIFPVLFLSACSLNGDKAREVNKNELNIVGNDRDEHGCIASAGYSWCGIKQKCLRSWEEKCEEVATSTNEIATSSDKIYTDIDKQFSINFFDGYSRYKDDQIAFGSQSISLEDPGSGVMVPNYFLKIVDYKSAKDIISGYNIVANTTLHPTIVKVGDFEVVKYAEGGMCEDRVMEVIGKKYNYRFFSTGCVNDQTVDFNYLTKTIEQLKITDVSPVNLDTLK